MSVTDAPAGLRLALVDAPDDAFNGLTYPRYRQVLAGAEHTALRARQLAIGAWLHDVPVGLAYLSEPLPAQPCPEGYDPLTLPAQGCVRQLLSVMVQPLVRGAGVGRRLLAAAAEFAAAAGAVRLDALHSDRLPGLEAYKAVLRSAGWSEPVLQECRIVGKVAWVVPSEADWAPLRARWRSQGYSADAWTTVGDAEREDIARLMRERVSEAERAFDPLLPTLQQGIVPELSLLLRRHGEIVGWLFGTPGLLPESIWYSQGYVLPEVRRHGWLLAGMRDVCERQLDRMGPESICMFLTSGSNLAMQRVIERRFSPYADWTDARYRSEKVLVACGENSKAAGTT